MNGAISLQNYNFGLKDVHPPPPEVPILLQIWTFLRHQLLNRSPFCPLATLLINRDRNKVKVGIIELVKESP